MVSLRDVSRRIRNRLSRLRPRRAPPIAPPPTQAQIDETNRLRVSANLTASRGPNGTDSVAFFPVDDQTRPLVDSLQRTGVIRPGDRPASTLAEVCRSDCNAVYLLRRDPELERSLTVLDGGDRLFSVNDLELVAYPTGEQTPVTAYRRLRLSYRETVVPPLHFSNYAYLQYLKTFVRPGMKVLDAFAGPGTVGLPLAEECGLDEIALFDLNPASVEMIRRNAAENFGERLRCSAFVSNLFADIPTGLNFDLIVGNPPHNFDAAERYRDLPPLVYVQAHDRDMQIHREFFRQAIDRLNPRGRICLLENGQSGCIQLEHIRTLLADFPQLELQSHRDMTGSPFYTFTAGLR